MVSYNECVSAHESIEKALLGWSSVRRIMVVRSAYSLYFVLHCGRRRGDGAAGIPVVTKLHLITCCILLRENVYRIRDG